MLYTCANIDSRSGATLTYVTDEELAALPDEPEQRFIELERIVRARYEEGVDQLRSNESNLPLLRRYMSLMLPAAKHYGISELLHWAPPQLDADWDFYSAFMLDVDCCITTLRLRNFEQNTRHSVALTADTKTKLREMLGHIRKTVDSLEISVAKKEALFKRINALQEEIDRDRTRLQAFAGLMIEACDDIGEAAKKLEPVVRLVERVGSALGVAKRAEDSRPRLPPRKEPKRIGSQPRKKNGFERAVDDEVPF
jgi:hypothetical protein